MTKSPLVDSLSALDRTPLYELHLELGARMASFAGYEMPIQYRAGVLKEHLATRASAGLFDVSHMGQVSIRPRSGRLADAALALERLVPADIAGLEPGRQRYTFFTAGRGGILDDLMVANCGDHLFLVVNGNCKAADIAYLQANLASTCEVSLLDRGLIALQGPLAGSVLARLAPVSDMVFMDVRNAEILGVPATIARSGYTGEDGFEISLPAERTREIAAALLDDERVHPIGLGARDSLRLEAGLCLYGADIDEMTTPVEAGLTWAISRVRRAGGARANNFPGAAVILNEIANGATRRRVGLVASGRAPVRAGADLYRSEESETAIGTITSGGFGPTCDRPVAMGYVPDVSSAPGTRIFAEVRGQRLPMTVTQLPFVQPNFKRG